MLELIDVEHGAPVLLSPVLFFMSVVVPVCPMPMQDQYHYLYKAVLSLVSTAENGLGHLARDINGTIVRVSNQSEQAESMESLV